MLKLEEQMLTYTLTRSDVGTEIEGFDITFFRNGERIDETAADPKIVEEAHIMAAQSLLLEYTETERCPNAYKKVKR